jgi:hypothetical protein
MVCRHQTITIVFLVGSLRGTLTLSREMTLCLKGPELLGDHAPLLVPVQRKVAAEGAEGEARLRTASTWQAVGFLAVEDGFDQVGGQGGQADGAGDVRTGPT